MYCNSSLRQAANYFKNGDYQQALKCYQQAAKLVGVANVQANILLCEKRLNTTITVGSQTPIASPSPSMKLEALQKENQQLKRQIKEKQRNIDERFRELAILTQMCEEKDKQLETLSERN